MSCTEIPIMSTTMVMASPLRMTPAVTEGCPPMNESDINIRRRSRRAPGVTPVNARTAYGEPDRRSRDPRRCDSGREAPTRARRPSRRGPEGRRMTRPNVFGARGRRARERTLELSLAEAHAIADRRDRQPTSRGLEERHRGPHAAIAEARRASRSTSRGREAKSRLAGKAPPAVLPAPRARAPSACRGGARCRASAPPERRGSRTRRAGTSRRGDHAPRGPRDERARHAHDGGRGHSMAHHPDGWIAEERDRSNRRVARGPWGRLRWSVASVAGDIGVAAPGPVDARDTKKALLAIPRADDIAALLARLQRPDSAHAGLALGFRSTCLLSSLPSRSIFIVSRSLRRRPRS